MIAVGAIGACAGAAGADDDPQLARAIVPPAGFGHEFWSKVPAPTSLAFGPDGKLYVTSLDGSVYVIGKDRFPRPFATGLTQPLGVVVADDGRVYVSDSEKDGDGLAWGKVLVLEDGDGNGSADRRATVVERLPNGRHNTNGLAFGPDGDLYVANGNRTDDGIECGPPPTPVDCGNPGEDQPLSGSLIRVDPDARGATASDDMVVATGMRNVFDVAFWPNDRSIAYLPTNGPDDPAADDVLYATDVDDFDEQPPADPEGEPTRTPRIDDMGFPSCLYNAHENAGAGEVGGHHEHGKSLSPMDNPNAAVIERFGPCPKDSVHRPVATFGGHVSADGLAFAHGSRFPGSYANDLFVAEWGNMWGAEDGHAVGHKIVRVNLRDDGTIARDHHGMPSVTEFASGALPIDLAFGPDGAMYVADQEGFVHRIPWNGTTPPAADEEDQAPPPGDDHEHGGGGDHDDDTECPAGTRHEHNHDSGRTECEAFEVSGWRGTWEPATQDDDPEPSEGDRGWAWRLHDPDPEEGGGHHHDGFDPGCSQVAVDELVERMKRTLARFDNDPWRAGADGYWMYPIGWKTYHMVNTSLYGDGRDVVPEHVESFIYAMTDGGLKAMGGMFTLDKEWKKVPPERLPGYRASNGEVCRLPWHNHVEEEGAATSFDPEDPTTSNWMAHVWVHGYDVFERGTDGTEASGWWWPYRSIPTFCNDDGGCL
ncbi:MAG: PQQ-dependent sugar dehydrogenase [Actinomycetota bacterium]|nr:PQQ-dependent sugar dehydrogenase [Actinomycetota bacterium]